MPRCSLLLLVAGAIAGGCSRDAPLVAPRLEAVDAIVTPSPSLAASPADPTGGEGAIDDALGRLIPSLDADAAALGNTLLKLKAKRGDEATRNDVARLLELLASRLPASSRADLDALRLDLGVPTK
jgi:hypothetical protein